MENRTTTLLKAAKALLIKQRDAGILVDKPLTVPYDDTECDGYCLIDDIAALLDELNEIYNVRELTIQQVIEILRQHNDTGKPVLKITNGKHLEKDLLERLLDTCEQLLEENADLEFRLQNVTDKLTEYIAKE